MQFLGMRYDQSTIFESDERAALTVNVDCCCFLRLILENMVIDILIFFRMALRAEKQLQGCARHFIGDFIFKNKIAILGSAIYLR